MSEQVQSGIPIPPGLIAYQCDNCHSLVGHFDVVTREWGEPEKCSLCGGTLTRKTFEEALEAAKVAHAKEDNHGLPADGPEGA